jgi:phage-related minor tail protein
MLKALGTDENRMKVVTALQDGLGMAASEARDLVEALDDVAASLGGIVGQGYLETFTALGDAMAQGKDAGEAMGRAFSDMMLKIIDALPSLFLSAGLQAIIAGQWQLGLGLVAAAGVAAYAAGAVHGTVEKKTKAAAGDQSVTMSARGNVFGPYTADQFRAFGRGGVVTSYTGFDHAGGRGAMGEAGPEGILPLGRDNSGRLGVRLASGASGGERPVSVTVNNYAGAEVRATESNGPDGRQIEVLIQKAVRNELNNGGADQAMRQRYGVRALGRNAS